MRPTQTVISLSALRANFALVRSLVADTKIAAVVKADAYGHGALECANALVEQQTARADCLAVACIDEALQLRDAGVSAPILLLEGHFSAAELDIAARQDLWLMVHNAQQIEQLHSTKLSKPLTIWLKVDGGMHRLGFEAEHVAAIYKALQASAQVEGIVLASHFATADMPEKDADTARQIENLQQLNSSLQTPLSLANSAAILAHPKSHQDWVRPGIMLYGSSPFSDPTQLKHKLQPVMSLCSKVISLRDVKAGDGVGYGHDWHARQQSRIATVAVGYGDGYPRSAESGTPVLIGGQTARLCGRVSMDMITVDVSELNNVQLGADVQLWGPDLSVDTVANHAGSLGYELLTRMPRRPVRKYLP